MEKEKLPETKISLGKKRPFQGESGEKLTKKETWWAQGIGGERRSGGGKKLVNPSRNKNVVWKGRWEEHQCWGEKGGRSTPGDTKYQNGGFLS